MAGIRGKELDACNRRITSVTNHLAPVPRAVVANDRSSGRLCKAAASSDDSYHRLHGAVSAKEVVWRKAEPPGSEDFTDIVYEKADGEGIAKITINRPERRNAFRPATVKELSSAFSDARDDGSIGVVILTGKGTKAFL